MASDIETIRILIGDRKKKAINEVIGKGDGSGINYKLSMYPLCSSPTAVLTIRIDGATIAATNWNISGNNGALTFVSAPTANAEILGSYEYYTLTSGELSDFLSGLTGSPYLAASRACLALAGDSSRYFSYSMGEKIIDKRKISQNFRDLSKSLSDMHYMVRDDSAYDSKIFTMQDNTDTAYDEYDDNETVFITTGTGA